MSDSEITGPDAPSPAWLAIAEGDYAIVELFGHTTLVGRIAEVERFGTKMLAIEPLFNGRLLDPIYHGGAAIYRLSPCSRQVAWQQQPRQAWALPAVLRALVPPEALPPPAASGHEPDDDYSFSGADGTDDDDP